MGRGLMIFIVGMFIVMGIFNFASQNRLVSSEEDMARQVHYTMASTTAMSALEMAGQVIVLNQSENFRDDGDIWESNLEHGSVSVLMNRSGNNIQLVSTGITQGVTATVIGEYQLRLDGNMPILEGAVGIYSKDLAFRISGSSFMISGCDHLPGVATNPNCDDAVLGIAVNQEDHYNTIEDNLNNNQKGRIQGSEGSDEDDEDFSVGIVENDGSFIDEAIDYFGGMVDENVDGYFNVNDETFLGSHTNPKVIRVRNGGTLRVSSSDSGSGVIIVDPGAELDVRGNFTYRGLIIVQGKADLTRGNMHLYGGMLVGGEEPEIQIYESSLDLRGNINIRYSSEVMDFLDERFSANSGNRRLVLQQIYQ
ncbi:MAG: hypothetical protein LAT84_03075 [Balneolia bacterium]|nr:hypothetical protein [Balneolia bacterium]